MTPMDWSASDSFKKRSILLKNWKYFANIRFRGKMHIWNQTLYLCKFLYFYVTRLWIMLMRGYWSLSTKYTHSLYLNKTPVYFMSCLFTEKIYASQLGSDRSKLTNMVRFTFPLMVQAWKYDRIWTKRT